MFVRAHSTRVRRILQRLSRHYPGLMAISSNSWPCQQFRKVGYVPAFLSGGQIFSAANAGLIET